MSVAVTDSDGTYRLQGLAPGGYLLSTQNVQGYTDQLYGGEPLVSMSSCDTHLGDPVFVNGAETVSGIDFALSPPWYHSPLLQANFGYGGINRKIWDQSEFVRRVEAESLVSRLTRSGWHGRNGLDFSDPNDPLGTGVSGSIESSISAEVRIDEVCNNGAVARAQINGYFDNDGTDGIDQAGEVLAAIEIRHVGNDGLKAAFYVSRCLDDSCDLGHELVFDQTTLGPPTPGQTHTLSISFDGSTFVFGFDEQSATVPISQFTPVVRPSQYFQRTSKRFKGIGTRVSHLSGPYEGGYISARIDNVWVNGMAFDDFSNGKIHPDKRPSQLFKRTGGAFKGFGTAIEMKKLFRVEVQKPLTELVSINTVSRRLLPSRIHVYPSADEASVAQWERRLAIGGDKALEVALPTESIRIEILVEVIRAPERSLDETVLGPLLRKRGVLVRDEAVRYVLAYYDIKKNGF
ncbi:MAG: hypothetical protein GY703_25610 [Gammaproteobacteria bacterium]|nr:hypothetical protein [Gammaproteobacteria bacterium]